ncbi:MAG TPA: DNA topoisomerase [Bacillota bacterium]|nr:DNA topoisomerase [Bacillota bacterium]
MSILILTEKPSVARSIANALGKPEKGDGYLKVNQYIITWAVGHLVSLAQPEAYHPEWKTWRMDQLPMIPPDLKLIINRRTSKQFQVVKELLLDPNIEKVIFATDAGPEGELIARWIYEKCHAKKLIERLWISSLTKEAILTGMKNLQPSAEYDRLFQSAAARARADWIVGLNATRAVTCAVRTLDSSSTTYTVGRVQTPTLKLVVDRDREIQDFKSETYFEVTGTFQDQEGERYVGKWVDSNNGSYRIHQKEYAEKIVEDTLKKMTEEITLVEETVSIPPPTLLSLSLLQQQASQRFHLTVAEVTDLSQELYEQGLITYPRTADCLVTPDVAACFPSILTDLKRQGYEDIMPPSVPSLQSNDRYVGEVTDHHAIIPTGRSGKVHGKLADIYDHIVRTFVAAHHSCGTDLKREMTTWVNRHPFLTRETITIDLGWRKVWGHHQTANSIREFKAPVTCRDVQINEQETMPPSRYTEASLLKQMEKYHLGTPATRSGTIEKLKQQQYILLDQQSLSASPKAFFLMDQLQDSPLVSISLTAEWEKKLELIQNGELSIRDFNWEVNQLITTIIDQVKQGNKPKDIAKKGKVIGKCPCCDPGTVIKKEMGSEKWLYGCNQYPGCHFFVSGEIGGQRMEDEDITRLLTKGRTKQKEFYFKNKVTPTTACLTLNTDGSTAFDFSGSLLTKVKKFLLGSR